MAERIDHTGVAVTTPLSVEEARRVPEEPGRTGKPREAPLLAAARCKE
jgi:hypothetical protein